MKSQSYSSSASPAASTQDRPLLGMIYACIGLSVLPVMDSIAKYLSDSLSAVEIAWWRFALQLLLLPPIIAVQHFWPLDDEVKRAKAKQKGTMGLKNWRDIALQMLPGVFIALATSCFFYALQFMSMAKTLTIFFVEPMIVTVLSVFLLGETIKTHRILAIVAGFVGVLIVMRPSVGADAGIDWYVVLPLMTACFFAGYLLMLRHIARRLHPLKTQWYVACGATLCLSLILQLHHFGWDLPMITPKGVTWDHAYLLLGMCATAIVGHLFLISATSKTPANVLAPLAYIELISATVLGYLVFAEIPDRYTVIGGAIIITSGLYLMYREQRQEKLLQK